MVFGTLAIYLNIGTKGLRISQKGMMVPKVKWLLIFPISVFLIGLTPHLGLKNVQVFAMFSNLRTEGGNTNHLFIPSSFQLFDNLEDLVTIKRSNRRKLNSLSGYLSNRPFIGTSVRMPSLYVKYMRENYKDFRSRFKYKIPFTFLQNGLTMMAQGGAKDIELLYERNGKTFHTKNAELDPDLNRASFLQRKLLFMRAIPDDDRGLCMW